MVALGRKEGKWRRDEKSCCELQGMPMAAPTIQLTKEDVSKGEREKREMRKKKYQKETREK